MKKWIVIIFIFILGITATLYFLIPTTQSLNNKTTVNCTESAASRLIINKNKWQLWWPGAKIDDTTYTFRNFTYRIDKILLDGLETTIFNNKDSMKAFLQFIYFGNDSTRFQWRSNYIFSTNPIKRFKQYVQLRE